eukprot:TRINITY_DN24717_c0_g1_i1.p1 TRINITY_DN24717_c0_g1~~TRINITY_DN24717_c0_g1_i1.p1  ORF type:complete len:795 (+),score=361.13 TRINITY_DN24717_c0_g1_i1:112-2496(+)
MNSTTGRNTSTKGSRAGGDARGDYGKWWEHCVQCIETFNPETHTVDTHTFDVIKALGGARGKRIEEDHEDFIKQVFYGTVRYKKMIDLCIKTYTNKMRRMNDSPASLAMLSYLVMFRLDELGMVGFKTIIAGNISPTKAAEYLTFVFDPVVAEEHLAPVWRTVFDDAYVEDTLITHIREHSSAIMDLAESLVQGATALEEAKQQKKDAPLPTKPSTVPQPFALSQNNGTKRAPAGNGYQDETKPKTYRRPRDDPEAEKRVEAILQYKQKKQASTLNEETKRKNREREAAKPAQPPTLHTLARPSNMETVRRRAEEEREVPPPVPVISPDIVKRRMAKEPKEAPKLTSAAILREEAVYTKREREEEEIMKRKIIELRDDTEFKAWQKKCQDEDDAAKRAEISQRKVEMMLADEEARVARIRERQKRAKVATKIKEEISEQLDGAKQVQEKLLEDNRAYAQKQNEVINANLKRVKTKMMEEKVGNARLVKEEDMLLELKAAERLELELQQRAELIKEIRESVRKQKYDVTEDGRLVRKAYRANFDPETTMGFGKLNEMSLVELQGKLQETKENDARWVEMQRCKIEDGRETHKLKEERRLGEVLKRRQNQREISAAHRQRKREEEERLKNEKASKDRVRLQALQAKLQEKREFRLADEDARREQERQRVLEQQLQSADGGAIEFTRWVEKERGAQNIVITAQKNNLKQMRSEKALKDTAASQRTRNVDTMCHNTAAGRAAQDAQLRSMFSEEMTRREHTQQSVRDAASREYTHKRTVKTIKGTNEAFDAIDAMLAS